MYYEGTVLFTQSHEDTTRCVQMCSPRAIILSSLIVGALGGVLFIAGAAVANDESAAWCVDRCA